MTSGTCKLLEQLVRYEMKGIEDNLYRARLQKKANPNWMSGNGQTINQMIAGYQQQLSLAEQALTELNKESR